MRLGKLLKTAPVVLTVGCGPSVTPTPDWMIGWFTDAHPDLPLSHNAAMNIHVFDDHTVEIQTSSDCGGYTWDGTMTWEAEGESAIRLSPPDDSPAEMGAPIIGYKIYRRPECGEFEQTTIINGEEQAEHMGNFTQLYNARLCMTDGGIEPDCVGSGCNICHKAWCEGTEPPACEEE